MAVRKAMCSPGVCYAATAAVLTRGVCCGQRRPPRREMRAARHSQSCRRSVRSYQVQAQREQLARAEAEAARAGAEAQEQGRLRLQVPRPVVLCLRYAMSSTGIAYRAVLFLCLRCAMSGTDVAYRAGILLCSHAVCPRVSQGVVLHQLEEECGLLRRATELHQQQ
eukprot:241548-Rhodomonas_salina.5